MKKILFSIALIFSIAILCCSCSSKTDEFEYEISDLKSQVSDLESRINELESQVEVLESQVEQQNCRINDLEFRQIFNW